MATLQPQQTAQYIRAMLQDRVNNEINALIHGLVEVGERVVAEQRRRGIPNPSAPSPTLKGDFKNQTANLRSSMGYIITYKGKKVAGGAFEQVKSGENLEGVKTGEEYAKEVAGQYTGNGIQLVVVAGMNYAKYVHNKGYDVLDTAELLADKLIEDLKDEYR